MQKNKRTKKFNQEQQLNALIAEWRVCEKYWLERKRECYKLQEHVDFQICDIRAAIYSNCADELQKILKG